MSPALPERPAAGGSPGHFSRLTIITTGLAVALLLGLALCPTTGWLTREQFHWQFRSPAALIWILDALELGAPKRGSPSGNIPALRIAARYPQDVAVQIAAAEGLPALQQIAERFPRNPAAIASVLRQYLMHDVYIMRPEVDNFDGAQFSRFMLDTRPPPSPTSLDAFLTYAGRGEKIDPQNGYFSALRAVGLFATGRDLAARQALAEAAAKPAWTDYADTATDGQWKLVQNYSGDRSVLAHAFVRSAALYPEYGQFRAVARTAVYLAAMEEKQGHPAQGIDIRHDLMAWGALMRSQGSSDIVPLVGIAITEIAAGRIEGLHPSVQHETPARRRQKLEANYLQYLTAHGRPDEARWVKAQFTDCRRARDIIVQGAGHGPFSLVSVSSHVGEWSLDTILLTNAVWLLAMGVAALLLGYRPGWKFTPAVPVLLLIVLFGLGWSAHWWSILGSAAQALMGLHEDAAAAPTAPTTLVGFAGMFFTMAARVSTVTLLVLEMAIPLLALFVATTVGLCDTSGFKRRFLLALQLTTPALALIAVVLYAALVVKTARDERTGSVVLSRMEQSTGRYFASVVHQPWPPR